MARCARATRSNTRSTSRPTRTPTRISTSRPTTPTPGTWRSGRCRTSTQSTSTARFPYWNSIVEHPDYDAFWKDEAWVTQVHGRVRAEPQRRRVLGSGGSVGPVGDLPALRGQRSQPLQLHRRRPVVSRAVAQPEGRIDRPDLVRRPRHRAEFREKIEAPWFRYWLHGKGEKFPWKASTFQTGSNSWQTYAAWPPKATATNLYLRADGALSFDAAAGAATSFVQYVSDPANPVPYRAAPDLADLSGGRLAAVGGRGSALRRQSSRRRHLGQRAARSRSDGDRRTRRRSVRVDLRHRQRFRRQADRRLSRNTRSRTRGTPTPARSRGSTRSR